MLSRNFHDAATLLKKLWGRLRGERGSTGGVRTLPRLPTADASASSTFSSFQLE